MRARPAPSAAALISSRSRWTRAEARTSPGVQLTLDLTRHLCDDARHRRRRFHRRRRSSDDRSRLARPAAALPTCSHCRRANNSPPPCCPQLIVARAPRASRRAAIVHLLRQHQGETLMNFFEPTDPDALTAAFPHKPFALKHRFAGNPLLTLPRIVELVRELPRDRIEYNSGKAAISQNPDTTPTVDLDPEDDRPQDRDRRRLDGAQADRRAPGLSRADRGRADGSRARPADTTISKAAGFEDIRASSSCRRPNSTTPFHADSDENFFFQIHGEKLFHVYDNQRPLDRLGGSAGGVVVKHRNMPYEPKFDAKLHHLQADARRRHFRSLSMAALGAHRRQLFDLAVGHLEIRRCAPAQRYLHGQFDAAQHRHAAEPARREPGARQRQARDVPRRRQPRSRRCAGAKACAARIRRLVLGPAMRTIITEAKKRRTQGVLVAPDHAVNRPRFAATDGRRGQAPGLSAVGHSNDGAVRTGCALCAGDIASVCRFAFLHRVVEQAPAFAQFEQGACSLSQVLARHLRADGGGRRPAGAGAAQRRLVRASLPADLVVVDRTMRRLFRARLPDRSRRI